MQSDQPNQWIDSSAQYHMVEYYKKTLQISANNYFAKYGSCYSDSKVVVNNSASYNIEDNIYISIRLQLS